MLSSHDIKLSIQLVDYKQPLDEKYVHGWTREYYS